MNLKGKIVQPGDLIGQIAPNVEIGDGIYVKNNNMFASLYGKIDIDSEKINEGEAKHTIKIQSSIQNKSPCLQLGQVVIGKIIRLKEDLCHLKIMMIEDQPINSYLEGVIRKQNVRESEVDKLEMQNCFIPGDIVKAKIISLGDSTKVFLSTVGDDLGVLFAKDQEMGQLMLPYSWNQMISLQTGLKEERKVAKPNIDLFQAQQ
ncbi:Nucleic acid-binding, OB-fold [Pseudocohnilembus persalinus]|uniref:Nucleic acid-binding, OB-fold n=1 Tax=Pseudocohnilembus persalinus TaxID=266149 RepID=A0A0V0R088_PSEPJ|nr:Nucleic acid-binding, OB-fold [Pseudocohnilembus persalinus]|eukprot:KRX07757.1 Nucleic acid-binding, OB-fold [Pseudocohnilembus persalinus]